MKNLDRLVSDLITAYENATPILHYNLAYTLSYYDSKKHTLRSRKFQQRQWFFSYFVPTGGLFSLFLFRRRIKRTFKSILSTCDLYLYEMGEESNSQNEDWVDNICKRVGDKRIELIKTKTPQRSENFTTALQVASIITGFITLAGIQGLVGGVHLHADIENYLSYFKYIISVSIGIVMLLLGWVVFASKLFWYRRTKKIYDYEKKEKPVYDCLIQLLQFVQNKRPNTKFLIDSQLPKLMRVGVRRYKVGW